MYGICGCRVVGLSGFQAVTAVGIVCMCVCTFPIPPPHVLSQRNCVRNALISLISHTHTHTHPSHLPHSTKLFGSHEPSLRPATKGREKSERSAERAEEMCTTSSCSLLSSAGTTPPSILLHWPPNNTPACGYEAQPRYTAATTSTTLLLGQFHIQPSDVCRINCASLSHNELPPPPPWLSGLWASPLLILLLFFFFFVFVFFPFTSSSISSANYTPPHPPPTIARG